MIESSQTDSKLPTRELVNDQIKIERYKFILEKIKFLDKQIHVNLNITITVFTSLITLLVLSIVAMKENKIGLNNFIFSVRTISFIAFIFSLYMVFSSIAIIRSWFDYRNEESDFLDKISCDIARKKPKKRNFFRWSETYFIIFIFLFLILSLIIFFSSNEFILNISE
ncbi:TPA: hypothetical protein VEO38_002875 [Providencia alcalifaciens]|nr:hypothetical protein [Providencia alcalifaciens]